MADAKKKFLGKITLPKITFKDTPINAFLVVALVIFAFLLGMLTNKVIYLEKQLINPTTGTQAALPAGQEAYPTVPPVVEGISSGHLPLLGKENAKVTIVAFSDLQCPYCKKFIDDGTLEQIKKEYVDNGKVAFAFRHFPLTSIHPNAQKAAEAAECANEQGQFWKFHDLVFENQDTWSPLTTDDAINSFVDYAGQLGLNTSQFQSCVESDKYKDAVDGDTNDGFAAQVDGTPAFFVNGVRVVGAVPFEQFKTIIEEELKK